MSYGRKKYNIYLESSKAGAISRMKFISFETYLEARLFCEFLELRPEWRYYDYDDCWYNTVNYNYLYIKEE